MIIHTLIVVVGKKEGSFLGIVTVIETVGQKYFGLSHERCHTYPFLILLER